MYASPLTHSIDFDVWMVHTFCLIHMKCSRIFVRIIQDPLYIPRSVSPLSMALVRANWSRFIFISNGTCSAARASKSNSYKRRRQVFTLNSCGKITLLSPKFSLFSCLRNYCKLSSVKVWDIIGPEGFSIFDWVYS